MKIYKSVKNGATAKLIELNDSGAIFEMEDGTQKEFAMSTFKRWWKLDSETPDEVEKANDETEVIEENNEQEEQQESQVVDNNVDTVDNPINDAQEEKEVPAKGSKLTSDVEGLLDFIYSLVKEKGLAAVPSGYGVTVKKDEARFSKVNFKFYPRRKYVKVRVAVDVLEEAGVTGNVIENDPDNAYIHLSENNEVSQSIIEAIINSTL